MSAIAHSLRLARIDVRRMLRKQLSLERGLSSLAGLFVYAVLLVGATAGGGYLGLRLGEGLAGGAGFFDLGAAESMIGVRGILALFWLMFAFVYALRAFGQRGTLAQPEGTLTVVPVREALGGLLLAEFVYLLLWILAPALGLGVGFAVGAGIPWPAVALPVAAAAAGLSGLVVGFLVGLALRHGVSRFEFVARNKGLLLVAVFVLYFVALSSGAWNELMVSLFEPMQRTPVGWFADLGFLGMPGLAASPVNAGGALLITALLGVLGIVAGTAIADRHWFSDPVLAGSEEEPAAEASSPGLERRLAAIVGRRTAALMTLSWRRAKRSPLKLLYAFYPLLIMAGLLANIVQTGEVPSYLPYAVLLFAAWAAGVIFTLNPLGDQGAALPSTLLSGVDGRTFVRAHVVAGLLVAVPVGTLLTAVVAVLSPVDDGTVIALVVATPLAMVVAAALSVGIGLAFPRFEATTVTRSVKTVIPSRLAFLLFSLHLFATALAAGLVAKEFVRQLVAAILSFLLPVGLTVLPETLWSVGAVLLVPLLLAPIVSYRYAIRRYDRFTLS